MDDYTHIGIKVPVEDKRRLRIIAAHGNETITDILRRLISDEIDGWKDSFFADNSTDMSNTHSAVVESAPNGVTERA